MLKHFFLVCSGADTTIIKSCSESEQNKYVGIGATIFFTAIMAFISSSFALYTVFEELFSAIFFGLIWSLLIFNLDRFIVSTIKKQDRFKDEFLKTIPRIILAVIIATVISKPLELKIFEKEINQVLLEEKNTLTLANKNQLQLQYSPMIKKLQQNISDLKIEISEQEAKTNTLYNIYISEAEGKAGTQILGKGPVYKEKREKHDAALTTLIELKEKNAKKISDLETQISTLDTNYANAVKKSQPIIDNFDGLMARITALGKLPFLPSFFIFLLFLAIETSPIIAKLLAPKGTYDIKLEDQENAINTWVTQKIKQREQLLNTDISLNEKIYSEIKEEENVYAYKKKKTVELLKLQADTFHSVQTKNLQ